MKAKYFYKFAFLFILIIITITGCDGNDNTVDDDIRQKASIGVIETTGYKNKSFIHFYDSDLNFLYKEENNYASLSESWSDPIFQDENLYSIPRGMFQAQNESCIIEYSINTDEYNEYQTDLVSMNELALSKDYMFGVNTIDFISIISKNKIGDVEAEPFKKEFSDEYISEMKVMDEKLYCFSMSFKDNSTHFKCLSIEDLSVIYDFDITEYGSPAEMLKVGDKIYFTNQHMDEFEGGPSKMLTVFNEKDKSFSQIELSENIPNDILKYNDLLIISHYDRVQAEGGKITLYNLSENRIEKVIDLKHDAVQIVIKDDFLYIMGHDCITKSVIKNNDLEEICTAKVDMQNGATYFYLSSAFVCN